MKPQLIYQTDCPLKPGVYTGDVHLPKEESRKNGLQVARDSSGLLRNDDPRFLWTTDLGTCIPLVFIFKNGDILLTHVSSTYIRVSSMNFLHCKEMIDSIAEIHLYRNQTRFVQSNQNLHIDKNMRMAYSFTLLFHELGCKEVPKILLNQLPAFNTLIVRRTQEGIVHIAAHPSEKDETDDTLSAYEDTYVLTLDIEKAKKNLKNSLLATISIFNEDTLFETVTDISTPPLTFQEAEKRLNAQNGEKIPFIPENQNPLKKGGENGPKEKHNCFIM